MINAVKKVRWFDNCLGNILRSSPPRAAPSTWNYKTTAIPGEDPGSRALGRGKTKYNHHDTRPELGMQTYNILPE